MSRPSDGVEPPFSRTFLILLLILLVGCLLTHSVSGAEPRWAGFLAAVTAVIAASTPVLLAMYGV
ncbi:hypothetical protein [Actinocorallia populi]|uniref:hypothetical protein n=1 Tax=Actinocorallia populi TaxID=2079200 RepID=UPI00130052E2|nr:hypothetical protein [Actinocorallia populi]